MFFGPVTSEENAHIPEIAWHEVTALVPLVILMVWIGVHPNTFLRKMSPSVQQLLTTVEQGRGGGKSMVAKVVPYATEDPARRRGVR